MITARITFKSSHAEHFIENAKLGQNVIELQFESVLALIATIKQFEDAILDCCAIVDGKVIALSAFPAA
jgi:hypothetical protein